MEKIKQIEKILERYDIDDYHWKPEIAKDIAALYEGWYSEEFIKWVSTDTLYSSKTNRWCILETREMIDTLPELFQYWCDKVRQPDHVTMHDMKVDDEARDERNPGPTGHGTNICHSDADPGL